MITPEPLYHKGFAALVKQPAFVIIIRAVHTRGEAQQEALRALDARGLWLSDEQRAQAGLT